MQFKTAIKKYMKQNELSANKAAIALGTSRRNILFWKSGKHQPPVKKRGILVSIMSKGIK